LTDYPKLRLIEAFPAQDNLICLRDPLGFSDKMLLVPPNIYFICTLFDGKHAMIDIQAEYTRRFGDLLFSDKIKEIIEQLDQNLFLDSERFARAKAEAEEAFRTTPVRSAAHAGSAYESDPDKLRAQLDAYFTAEGGPGLPGSGRSDADRPDTDLIGLIAPHIDPRRGGLCYASSYAELFRSCSARTFVVFGISHMPTEKPFVLCDKDFETPLGNVPADRDLIAALSNRCRTDFTVDAFVHRQEHAVEFQALFLRYLYTEDITIVPLLCSSLGPSLRTGHSPYEDPEVRDFIDALAETLAGGKREICLLAGVDLSHIGGRFGQSLQLSPELLKRVEEDDLNMMRIVLDLDAEGFADLIAGEKDRRNVCGVPALYTMLKVIDAHRARLLRYDQAPEEATQSVVSFVSAAFYA